jgi:hypothetical protein
MKPAALPLEVLLQRISLADASILGEPKLATTGWMPVDAVVADFLDQRQLMVDAAALMAFSSSQPATARNRLQITLLLLWLLDAEALRQNQTSASQLMTLLLEVPAELAQYTTALSIVSDVERREELARLTLSRLKLLPAGETELQAQDRLNALSSAERARLMALNRAAEARARELHAAMVRRAAEEAADKMGRE